MGLSPFPCGAGQRLLLRVFRTGRETGPKQLIHGGHYWDRTSDPFDVNEVLYR
jgi:hypothetical protein